MRFLKTLLLILLTSLAVSSAGQSSLYTKFKSDFSELLDSSLSQPDLEQLMSKYGGLLSPAERATGFVFPLKELKNDSIYYEHIDQLLLSTNGYQRLIAYQLIAATGDSSKENHLIEKLTTETDDRYRLWAALALIYLGSARTTPLFDFLVKFEDFGDAHFVPMFMRLNKDSLQRTAYARLSYPDDKSRLLAAQTLMMTPPNPETERLLKEAVVGWGMHLKGWAIYPLKVLRAGHLLPVLQSLLDDEATRAVAWEALVNSPTEEDSTFVTNYVDQSDTVSRDVLNALLKSDNPNRVSYWLSLLHSRVLPAKYIFFTFEHPILKSDEILSSVQCTLERATDKNVLRELVRVLADKDDDRTVSIIQNLLLHKSPSVRYWAAHTVQNSASIKFKSPPMARLIASGLEDGNNPDE